MGTSREWDTTGADLAVVRAADYEEFGLVTEDEPADSGPYALVIGGSSGGSFVVEGDATGMEKFATRVLAQAFAALRDEAVITRTQIEGWVGRPVDTEELERLTKRIAVSGVPAMVVALLADLANT